MGAGRVPVSGERNIRAAVVSGERHQHLVLLQVAEEGIRRSPGAAGGPFCGGDAGAAGGCRRCDRDRSDRWGGAGHSFGRRCGHRGSGVASGEVMLNDFTGADHIFIKCGYTDQRRGIVGLAALVKQEIELDPFSNSLFLFCGRWRDWIKALYWEGNGFVLLYKRLESGSFQWPRKESEAKALTPQQYRGLMEGLSMD